MARAGVRGAWWVAWLVALCACPGRGSDVAADLVGTPPETGPEQPEPPAEVGPVTIGHWTYYGSGQGLSADVQDVSPDEGGNVYVAGGDALYVKRRGDLRFLRFDAENAGLTKNCNDAAEMTNETPATPFRQCRILSVGGAAAGKAIIGFDGFGIEAQHGARWALHAGGADVVAFDAEAGKLTRTRHVFIATPPHQICGGHETRSGTCDDPQDYWWANGRRLFHRVRRVVVNHDAGSPLYGDVWMAGEHATFAALLENASARGLVDITAGWPEFEDARDVREHLHPAITPDNGWFLNGEAWALSLDPRDGTPWGSNGFRTAYVVGYGENLAWDSWWMGPSPAGGPEFLDLWPDPPGEWLGAPDDQVHSMSHCPDGTLWIGSLAHGLARIDPDGVLSRLDLPDPALANGVSTVACDPLDGSVWIGPSLGGLLRLRAGTFEEIAMAGAPALAGNPVQSIQVDRWVTPRILYFAFAPRTDAAGAIVPGGGGGVASYDGP